jgi:polyphosphate glucokinase
MPAKPAGRLAIGVDVGGSGIKTAVVNVDTGELVTERIRVKTPQPSTPSRCIAVMQEIVPTVAEHGVVGPDAPVGVGLPAATIEGIVLTAANIDDAWLGFEAEDAIGRALGRRTTIVNDADAAGIAEMQFGGSSRTRSSATSRSVARTPSIARRQRPRNGAG